MEHRKEITKNAINKFIQSQTTCCSFILHLFALQLMQWILKRISFRYDITSLWCMRKCVFNHSSVSILYFQCVLFAFQVDASITCDSYRMHIVCSNTTSRKYYNLWIQLSKMAFFMNRFSFLFNSNGSYLWFQEESP